MTVVDTATDLRVSLIEDIPLCFNSHNKTNSLLRQNTTILYNYWYFVMASRFGLSLDHLQANVHK
jgi:hypothetical protein